MRQTEDVSWFTTYMRIDLFGLLPVEVIMKIKMERLEL